MDPPRMTRTRWQSTVTWAPARRTLTCCFTWLAAWILSVRYFLRNESNAGRVQWFIDTNIRKSRMQINKLTQTQASAKLYFYDLHQMGHTIQLMCPIGFATDRDNFRPFHQSLRRGDIVGKGVHMLFARVNFEK